MKSKILIFIDWYVPAYRAGGPIRSVFNIVQTFDDEFDFYIVCSDKDLGENKPLGTIISNQWQDNQNAQVIYLDAESQNSIKYIEIINEITPDCIYLNSLFSKKFTLLPLKSIKQNQYKGLVIIAPRGMFGKGALNIKPLKKKLFFLYAKLTGLFKNVMWHASTSLEKEEISAIFNSSKINIAENIALLPELNAIENFTESPVNNILFLSRVSVKKNLRLLVDALTLSKHKSAIKLTIIGGVEDQNYFDECCKIMQENNVHFDFKGALPQHELSSYFLNSKVFVLPTLHENYGHAIIESMSYGLPVVISQYTPWRDLQSKGAGYDLPLEPLKFAQAIDELIEMPTIDYLNLKKRARDYAESVLNNPAIIEANRKLFNTNSA